MSEKWFITILGTNSVGKTTLAYNLCQHYKENISTVGKPYIISDKDGRVKGGVDPMKKTNDERRQMLKELWMTESKIVLMQGMIILSKKNMDYYKKLSQEHKRNILVIYLTADNQKVIYPRLFQRSGGKQMTKKRIDGIKSITSKSKNTANYAIEIGLNVLQFQIKDNNSSVQLINKIKEIIV